MPVFHRANYPHARLILLAAEQEESLLQGLDCLMTVGLLLPLRSKYTYSLLLQFKLYSLPSPLGIPLCSHRPNRYGQEYKEWEPLYSEAVLFSLNNS